ncbi:MAG: ethanolamine ammonia-lyase reactivating factor EutA [Oscillospiraceae bacterium]|nr:ethanolamine ammonia-lyase reactivating factor EutA [Oscillospiraceae bacterium]
MGERLLSVGLDVGTTSTQMVLSELWIENRASAFSVPELEISQRKILYESAVHFTPLLQGDLVDGEGIRAIVAAEYAAAGITREAVDTGAIIITGETSRKENAATVLQNISDFAGDFVVATAGPDLESVLAAKGAGAVDFSAETGQTVLHIDIGGGTSNLARIENGKITATGCLNVGGRLLKFDQNGAVSYISPVLQGIFQGKVGDVPAHSQLEALADTLTSALEMAAGLREQTPLLDTLWTSEAGAVWASIPANPVVSFSGGVADCIENDPPDFAFGDIGPILGRAIRRSRLCQGPYRLGSETIRATVIGAGCHSAQLSGSTVFYQNVRFPLKNLPVVADLHSRDEAGVLALAGTPAAHYGQILSLADVIVETWSGGPLRIALQADMAKALGHALALRLPKDAEILCLDRVHLPAHSYLDIAAPVGSALPVVVKTLILNR